MAMLSNPNNQVSYNNYPNPISSFPSFSNANPSRKDLRFKEQQPDPRQQRQIELEARLEQLKRESAEASNPYYDNTFQHNRNIYRENVQNASLEHRNRVLENYSTPESGGDEQQKSNRGYDEENTGGYLKGKSKLNPRENEEGSFFDNFGNNKRHDLLQKEYRDFVKGNGNQSYDNNKKKADVYRSSEDLGRDRNKASLRKSQNHDQLSNSEDWYIKNFNVGILPGLGNASENPKTLRQQRTAEMSPFKAERREDYPRTNTRQEVPFGKIGTGIQERQGSRLAEIGSRLIDGNKPYIDDKKNFMQRLDEIKPPPSYEDYGNLNQRREIYNNVYANKSPQYPKEMGFQNFANSQLQEIRKSLEYNPNERDINWNSNNFETFLNKKSNNLDEFGGWRDNRGVEEDKGYDIINPSFEQRGFGEARNPPSNFHTQAKGREEQPNNRENEKRDGKGDDWLRVRQEEEADKRVRMKEELQRVYREQIEEKQRKKEEEKRKVRLEEQKEEERLKRETAELNRQFVLEQQKKKEQEIAKENFQTKMEVILDDFTEQSNARKKTQKNRAFETSDENSLKRDVLKPEFREETPALKNYESNIRRAEDIVKETAKMLEEEGRFQRIFELTKNPEFEVHKAVMRRLDATLDEQLEKMKRDLTNHTRLLREDQGAYKQQAMISQELRQNAQRELSRLRENLKMQQLDNEVKSFNDPNIVSQEKIFFLPNQQNSVKKNKSQEKLGVRIPGKSYAKLYPIDEGDVDLRSSVGLTLDVDTQYVPIDERNKYYNHEKTQSKKNNIENRDHQSENEERAESDDNAKNKFELLFPDHKQKKRDDNLYSLEAKAETEYISMMKELENQTGRKKGPILDNEHRYKYLNGPTQTRHLTTIERESLQGFGDVEGEDEIERLDKLLVQYRETIHGMKKPKKNINQELTSKKISSRQEVIKDEINEYNSNKFFNDDEILESNDNTENIGEGRLESITQQVQIKEKEYEKKDENWDNEDLQLEQEHQEYIKENN